jgi:hypothetical protein
MTQITLLKSGAFSLSVFLAAGLCLSPCPGDTSGAARSTVTAVRDCHLVEPFRRYRSSTTSPDSVVDTAAATTTGGTCPCVGSVEKVGADSDKRLAARATLPRLPGRPVRPATHTAVESIRL